MSIAYRSLADANVSIYPIDVSGLVARVPRALDARRPIPSADPFGSAADFERHSIMKDIAGMTGGKAFYNNNDLTRGLREAVTDSSAYYLVRYYRDTKTKFRPGWQSIRVKVARPGAVVRSRSGVPRSAVLDLARRRQHDFSLAADSPMDFTELVVQAEVDPSDSGFTFQVSVPQDIQGGTIPGAEPPRIEWLALIKADGKIVGKVMREPNAGEAGLTWSGALKTAASDYLIRFIARDRNSGRIGSLTLQAEKTFPGRVKLTTSH